MDKTGAATEAITIDVDTAQRVSGLLQAPPAARACVVLAHGAGAGMQHRFMAALADGLVVRQLAVLRYQFPYLERGSRRPDAPKLAQATVRAAVAEAARRCPELPLIAAGKSFGARMSSQAQAAAPLSGVVGLVFVGFPLHPAGQPSQERARHLDQVKLPMLFLQGTRDELADLALIESVVERLGERAQLTVLKHADHSFHVPARSGTDDAQVLTTLLDETARWIGALTHARG